MTSLSFQDSKFKTEEKSGTSLIKINDQETEIFLLATKESLWGKVWKMAGFPVFSLFQYNFHSLLPTLISQLFQYIGNLTMKDSSPPLPCIIFCYFSSLGYDFLHCTWWTFSLAKFLCIFHVPQSKSKLMSILERNISEFKRICTHTHKYICISNVWERERERG